MSPLIAKINEFDRTVTLAVANWHNKELSFILRIFTYSARGFAWFLYTLLLGILNLKGVQIFIGQQLLQFALIAPLITWLIGTLIKKIFKRKRPFQAMENFPALVYSPKDDSFPSMHAGSTASFFMALICLHHPWALWFGGWTIIVTFSRLYLGVHYLSDLIGGLILGIICGYLITIM